jgi:hypothetical protein
MEPRPPRPRSPHPFETPGSPETAGIGERLYPAPGEPAYYPGADAYAPGAAAEPPLLPRRKRRQQGALRGIAATVVVIAAVVALGWFLRDAVVGLVTPAAPTPTVVALDPAAATPPAGPQSAALPNALATVTPTPGSRATATAEPQQVPEAGPTSVPAIADEPAAADGGISAQTLPLLDLLPTQAQMPPGLLFADEAERSKAEVVDSLGGTNEASQLLDDWGWSGNAHRDFIADETAVAAGGSTFLNVSVHRFADPESAANAMVFFSDQVIFGQGLQEVEAPAIGESARLLVGPSGDAMLAVLYAQQGPIMYRIGGSAPATIGDPTIDVLAVAGTIIPGQADGG